MRRFMALFIVLLFQTTSQGWAQSAITYSRTEVSGGFSALGLGVGDSSRNELYGWQAGMTTNFTRRFGIASDFAGQYRNGINVRQSLFGPQFNFRSGGKATFIHALFGTSRIAGSNAFTIGVGSGLDLRVSDRFVIRAIQGDWLPARSGGEWSMDRVRLVTGIIVTFGNR